MSLIAESFFFVKCFGLADVSWVSLKKYLIEPAFYLVEFSIGLLGVWVIFRDNQPLEAIYLWNICFLLNHLAHNIYNRLFERLQHLSFHFTLPPADLAYT